MSKSSPQSQQPTSNEQFPRAVDTAELSAVLGPRLFMVSQVLWHAAKDDLGDLCPWDNDDNRRSDFLTGLANTLDDVLEILEQSHARACAEEADLATGGTR
jgi:hypothetical protein